MKKYVFKDYDPSYPKLFLDEKEKLIKVVGGRYEIEHIGSTAVPGLGGKGVIDIMIAAPRDELQNISLRAQSLGYEFKPSGGDEQRLFHQRDEKLSNDEIQRYHLHITFPESKAWREAIAFRDYLSTHPEDAKQYAEIKKQAAEFSDQEKEKYMAIKDPIIKNILSKALSDTEAN